jgi:putative flippase GtrA
MPANPPRSFLKMFFDAAFLRFVLVGCVNTVVGASIMFGLFNFTFMGYWLSSAISMAAGCIVSFILNNYFTFRARNRSFFVILKFFFVIAVSYLIAYGFSRPLVDRILVSLPQKARSNISLFSGMIFFTAINYIGQRFFTFKYTTGENHESKTYR